MRGRQSSKLGNSEVRGIVDTLVFEKLSEFMEENPSVARKIIEKQYWLKGGPGMQREKPRTYAQKKCAGNQCITRKAGGLSYLDLGVNRDLSGGR